MERRDFLLGAAGVIGSLSALRAAASSAPCPPAELGVSGGTRTATSCGPSLLPDWVPRNVGEAALVPTANGLQDVFKFDGPQNPEGHPSQFFCDYSGGIYNPFYGALGAHVVHGGGHAATNDNSVFILDYNQPRPEFKRVAGPTLLATSDAYEKSIVGGGFPDDPVLNPREVGPGEPGSAHTYDNLLILPPSVCGDPLGALIRPVASAIGIVASRETGWSHVLKFTSNKWERWSVNSAKSPNVGGSCAFDSSRGRIWPLVTANVSHSSYLDVATREWSNTPGTPQGIGGYPDMVYSCYHAARDIVIVGTNREAEAALSLFWFRGGSDGFARTPVNFKSGSVPSANWGSGSLVYAPDLDAVLFYTQRDRDAYYEIQVPSDPSASWSAIRRTVAGYLPSKLPIPPSDSTYKRLDYAPALKCLLWVTGSEKSQYDFGGQVLAIRVVA